jgi:hypothetical protein
MPLPQSARPGYVIIGIDALFSELMILLIHSLIFAAMLKLLYHRLALFFTRPALSYSNRGTVYINRFQRIALFYYFLFCAKILNKPAGR